MPVVGEFHEKFWADQSTVVPPPLGASGGGYPLWQVNAVTVHSLPLGPLGAFVDALIARCRWWWTLLRLIRGLSFNRRADIKAYAERLAAGTPPTPPGIVVREVERIIEKPVEVFRDRIVETVVKQVVEVPSVLGSRIADLATEQRAVLERSLTALESTSYQHAQTAVRKTAVTLGFTHPGAWKDLSHEIKSSPGRTENMYRHQKAMKFFREVDGSTHTNPDANLIVELAYQGFAVMGK